ncbi:hypothetical protein [Nostoc sp. MS1]|uniref:hypothetical protein n=1 Tax=Nostoc sp. MS1 TaxID=2764711 RepID=UPI001CC75532|nr:hypothetical protein [Nostoc sp. MS1]BCL37417.1 hypothetical protein NSMS1_38640 [Nostoc sp. MS1]
MATVITVCQTASAGKVGLNVGDRRITPGLEKNYLEYQIQNNSNGNKPIFVIPDNCIVGFGLRCNKTGTVLEKILESQGGPTYQQMLIRAAGGENNYRQWETFLGNRSDNNLYPYMSVWRNYSSKYLDAAQYSLGRTLDRNPVPGLSDVTKNFLWQPFRGDNLRDSFVNFKLSYGRLLLQEISKIPNIRQEILKLPIGESMKAFYEKRVLSGLDALESGDNRRLQHEIFEILSHPYNSALPDDNPFQGRNVATIESMLQSGEIQLGEGSIMKDGLFLGGGSEFENAISIAQGTEILSAPSEGFPGYLIAAPLLLLVILFLDGNGSNGSFNSSSLRTPSLPNPSTTPPLDNSCDFLNPGTPTNGGFCEAPITPPTQVSRVSEPSSVKGLLILTLILCLVRYKYRRAQVRY